MMATDEAAPGLLDLDWTEFQGGTPKEGVVYPQGDRKTDLVARMRKTFRKAGVKQVA